ncbi:MAG: glucose-6-phosphate dehydrogenase [Betaproteobacteria bacterium RIFCSPLOWO2_02_FULL_63_19]|nr:MAG: glucose-6-phosphate dehydrogenase [Betaproteobacteria bacterium RIFCSPLOWO2_02_FULL_63_19]
MNPAEHKSTVEAAPARPSDSCAMVIFGAGGDLTKRKLIPALHNLALDNLLSRQFAVIGFATTAFDTESFRGKLRKDLKEFSSRPIDDEIWEWLARRIYYVRGAFDDADAYKRLAASIAEASAEHGVHPNLFHYLAVAPRFFGAIVRQLEVAGLAKEDGGQWRRVIVEKPFGHDLETARALNAEIKQVLDERQIYRIDHYLGKETVQNLMVFRFGNGIFEPIWNRRYIDHVQITAAETVGVEQRGGYYETAGALRDMVPNHLSQLVSLTAMEPPFSFGADAVRDEQSKVLHAIQAFTPEDVLSKTVRGQYGEGMHGTESVPAYRAEPRVAPDSRTETYAALKLTIDNWRWAGVPFYLRTGKRMAKRCTEIAIQFRRAPFSLFRRAGADNPTQNRLVIRIQPDEGIALTFGAKMPGTIMRQGEVHMDFSYADQFGGPPSTGYERLLYDCMTGDQTLFQRADMVEAGWALIQPILDVWSVLPVRNFPNYAASTWGPAEANELLARDGRAWGKMPR